MQGDRGATLVLQGLLRDPDSRGDALDLLAGEAANGSGRALDLLLGAIDEHRLADKAIRSVVFDRDLVDDIRQEALIDVARGIHTFRGDARFTTWLYQVSKNAAFRVLRRRSGEQTPPVTETHTERLSSIIATRQTIAELIDELPSIYRTAVVLRDVEQMSYQEIADRLDLKLNTVKSHIVRGRALVASKLGDDDDDA